VNAILVVKLKSIIIYSFEEYSFQTFSPLGELNRPNDLSMKTLFTYQPGINDFRRLVPLEKYSQYTVKHGLIFPSHCELVAN
jgi:hypothetical protein